MSDFSCFDEADLEQIRVAAGVAESGTAGEIVTVIADASDDYPEAVWRAAAIGIVLGLAVAVGARAASTDWGYDPLIHAFVPVALGAALGAGLAMLLPGLRRLLAGQEALVTRVEAAAEAAFLEEAVFETRDRTGVLLFVTLFERRAVVLADEGVHSTVPVGVWAGVVGRLGSAMASGNPTAGIVAAIEECGRVLTEHRIEARPDDIDELDNRPRLRPS